METITDSQLNEGLNFLCSVENSLRTDYKQIEHCLSDKFKEALQNEIASFAIEEHSRINN